MKMIYFCAIFIVFILSNLMYFCDLFVFMLLVQFNAYIHDQSK